jgi:hypothetical protein
MTRSRSQAKNPIQPQADAGADLTRMFDPFISFHVFLKCRVIDVYTLIHSFLRERSHTKVASALKKAVHGVITLDDSTVHEGPTLQKILEEWRELKAAADAMYVQCPYTFLPLLKPRQRCFKF